MYKNSRHSPNWRNLRRRLPIINENKPVDSPANEILSLIDESRTLERAGEIAASIQRAKQAQQLAQAAGDAESEATALNALAYAHIRLGHYEQARELCDQALALAGPESTARADALLDVGICAGETDDLAASEQFTQQAVDLSRQIGYDRVLVRGLHALSCGIYMPRGQFALSLAADEESLKIARSRGMPEMAWGPLLTMSWVYWLTGQRQPAESRLAELHEAVSPGSLGDGYWHFIQASLALEDGDTATARDWFAKTLSIAEANGIAENRFLARLGMSRLSRAAGDNPSAVAWAADALAIVERTGYHHLQGEALIERARAAWALGDLPAAEADLRAAIERLAPLRLDFDRAIALLLLAALFHQQGHPGAADAWREAASRLAQGGFVFLADRERSLVFPLIVAGLDSRDKSVASVSVSLLDHLQQVPAPPMRIVTLGGWQVRVGARSLEKQALRQRRSGELLGLLLTSPGRSLSFDQVADVLWPEKSSSAAQALFHHATSTLRRALEPDLPEKFPSRYLEVSEGQVTLRLPPASTVDFETFEARYRQRDWAAALAAYSGEFLPEYRYADWAVALRQRLAQWCQHALLAVAEAAFEKGHFQESLEACQKVLALEPWQEQAALLGMRACLGLENRSGALRLYKTLEKSLRDDLGVEPQDALQTLYQSLLKR